MSFRSVARLAAFLVLATSTVHTARAQFGIAAGLNFDSIDDITFDAGDRGATFDAASGYHAGIFYDLGAAGIGLRVGLFYRDMGTVDVAIEQDGDVFDYAVDLSMIEVPIDLRIPIVPVSKVRPYLLAGATFGLPRSENEEFDSSLETTTISGVAGGGVGFDLGTVALFPEFRYVLGISGLLGDELTVGDRTILVDETLTAKSVQLRLGLRF